MKITKKAFYDLIQIERNAQDAKWGKQRHSDLKWTAIALEELGEVAKAVIEGNEKGLLVEIVQVAAVLENWVTSRGWYQNTDEDDERNDIS